MPGVPQRTLSVSAAKVQGPCNKEFVGCGKAVLHLTNLSSIFRGVPSQNFDVFRSKVLENEHRKGRR